ncbi:phosphatase PAP2 family protein [Streptomyces sp. NPDC020917]|uniref:phosphatase PAP2 family protein n=1 Tax=Streptomyces sp. NPDC020917 TaxID=3365102 RepID=UPI00379D0D8E
MRLPRAVADLPGRLHLPTGRRLLLPAGLAVALAVLAAVVLSRHGTPYAVDTGPHRWSVRHRPHGWAAAARAVTAAGTGPYPYLAAAVGGWLGGGRTARRGVPSALLAVLVLLAGQLVRTGLMAVFRRARPPAADWAAHASGYAFPSGHSASSAMAAGVLAWGLLRALPGPAGRAAAAVCGVAALLIGATRVYLGVHWPTDVLGGWLFAGCWLALALPPLAAFAGGGRPEGRPPPSQTDTPCERR